MEIIIRKFLANIRRPAYIPVQPYLRPTLTHSDLSTRLFYLFIGLFGLSPALAQPFGGQRLFAFLDLPAHARVAALGGNVVSATRPDGVYFGQNPALADSLMANELSLSYMPYLAAARHISGQYGLPVGNAGAGRPSGWAVGLQYLSYGQFELTDAAGNALGTFTAQDYALGLTHARTEGNFSLGATVKLVGSGIETYSALAILGDFGGVFRHPNGRLTVGLSARNAGVLLKNYFAGSDVDLPFDLLLGLTLKPRYAPVRLTITAHHLHHFDIAYNDPALTTTFDLNGNPVSQPTPLAEKLARHLSVGLEFLLSQNVQLLAGYNHQRRQEGRLASVGALAGFSLGASVQARGFQFTYAHTGYAPTAGTNQLSVRLDLNRWLR
jgi:hypothetical protein